LKFSLNNIITGVFMDVRCHKDYIRDCASQDSILDLATQIHSAADSVSNDVNEVGHHADATAQRLGLAGIGATERNGGEGRLITNQNGAEARSAIYRNGAETRESVERFGLANLESTRKEGHETREDVDKFGFHNANKIEFFGLKNFEATKDSLKDLLIQGCHNTSAIKEKLCQLELNQAKDTAAIQLEAAKNKCAIELDAARHAAEVAKQIAECCCETKMLITEKANHTDELIRKLDEQRVRDELRRTQQELEALRLRASLLPPLTPAVTV
jgi:hypothetical protein